VVYVHRFSLKEATARTITAISKPTHGHVLKDALMCIEIHRALPERVAKTLPEVKTYTVNNQRALSLARAPVYPAEASDDLAGAGPCEFVVSGDSASAYVVVTRMRAAALPPNGTSFSGLF